MRTQAEWKVEIHMRCATGPRRDWSRCLHFLRGLVRERNGENLTGASPARFHEVRDAVREHPRLTGTGTGDHQERTAGVNDGGLLLRIEALNEAIRRVCGS